jgi:hypothetical protein
MDPVLGREVEEREHLLGVVDDLGDGLGPLRLVVPLEGRDGRQGVVAVLGVTDLRDGAAGGRLRGLRQGVENVGGLMEPAPLGPGLKTSARAAKNPYAPSPTAIIGDRIPRRRRSRSTSAHDSVDSRIPSVIDTSSLVPSLRTRP